MPARLRDALVTTWGWTNIAVSTALFGTLAILTSWVPPRGRLYLFWARNWARSLLWLNRIPARLEVAEEAAALPQAIYMSNHESGIDILLLLLAIRQDVRFLAKRELFFVPLMGWSMWLAGFVPVDRKRTDKAKDVLSALDRRLASGISILVFPGGHALAGRAGSARSRSPASSPPSSPACRSCPSGSPAPARCSAPRGWSSAADPSSPASDARSRPPTWEFTGGGSSWSACGARSCSCAAEPGAID